jgi:hypothetical protein
LTDTHAPPEGETDKKNTPTAIIIVLMNFSSRFSDT